MRRMACVMRCRLRERLADADVAARLRLRPALPSLRTITFARAVLYSLHSLLRARAVPSHRFCTDATSTLYFYEPRTMAEVRRVTVQDEGQPVKWLNGAGAALLAPRFSLSRSFFPARAYTDAMHVTEALHMLTRVCASSRCRA